jgi:hypothetical protein
MGKAEKKEVGRQRLLIADLEFWIESVKERRLYLQP